MGLLDCPATANLALAAIAVLKYFFYRDIDWELLALVFGLDLFYIVSCASAQQEGETVNVTAYATTELVRYKKKEDQHG